MNDNIIKGLKNALVEYGAMLDDWKLKVIRVENIGTSDFANVFVEITKKKCKKPFIMWQLRINTVKELIYFDESSFCKY